MAENEKPTSSLEPKRPNLMLEFEQPLSLREAIEILTPRWLKRSSRRDRST